LELKLSLRPIARSRNGVEYGTGPVILYEIAGLPEGQNLSVRNIRPQSQIADWQIGDHAVQMETKWTGTFKTAQEALLELQREIDSAKENSK
jgi:hypothetical protein